MIDRADFPSTSGRPSLPADDLTFDVILFFALAATVPGLSRDRAIRGLAFSCCVLFSLHVLALVANVEGLCDAARRVERGALRRFHAKPLGHRRALLAVRRLLRRGVPPVVVPGEAYGFTGPFRSEFFASCICWWAIASFSASGKRVSAFRSWTSPSMLTR